MTAAATTDLRTGSVVVDGVRSPILESGAAGAEEAVVFVHGNPGSSRDWEDLLGRVGPFARAVALDMPGFGRADKPAGFDYTVPGYARHLAGALGELGVRRAHLVLHDFGGPWGLAWAVGNPEAFASLTLINVGVLPDYRWHIMARVWQTPLLGELAMATSSRRGFHLLLGRGQQKPLPAAFVDRMYDDFDAGTRRAVLKLYRSARDAGQQAHGLGAALRAMPRPVLVVWGADDPYISVGYAERQRETFPEAEIRVVPGSGHWPFIDNPEAVAGAVVPFLRRVVGGGAAAR